MKTAGNRGEEVEGVDAGPIDWTASTPRSLKHASFPCGTDCYRTCLYCTIAVNDVLLLAPTRPAGGAIDNVVNPDWSGINDDVAIPDPAVMAMGDPMVPTVGTLLVSRTCRSATPPRRDCWPT